MLHETRQSLATRVGGQTYRCERFFGCGVVDLLRRIDLPAGRSTYPQEFCQLHVFQELAADPTVHRLLTSRQTVTSNPD